MICDEIQKLMDYGLQNDLIQPEDRYVVQNQYMEIFQLNDWRPAEMHLRKQRLMRFCSH